MKKIIQLAVFLGVVCVIASGALYFSNSITDPIIKKNNTENTNKLLKEIVNDAEDFKPKSIESKTITNVYDAMAGGKKVSTVYEIGTYGFQSDIKVLLAINSDGKFSGFKVIEQAETPGYGTQIETNKKYQEQFSTKSVEDQVDTIAGSTVTTSALKKAIDEAVSHYKKNK